MKIKVNFKAVVINVVAREGKEGRMFYQISLDCDGDAGSLGCTEDVYKAFCDGYFKKYTECQIHAQINLQFQSLRVLAVEPA